MKNRQELIDFFTPFDLPVFNVTAPCEVANFLPHAKAAGVPSFAAMLHCLGRASLEVEPFRYRLANGTAQPIGETIGLSYTIVDANENLNFCNVDYDADIGVFTEAYIAARTRGQAATSMLLEAEESRDYLYVTCLPWFAFTSIQHPIGRIDDSSIPSIAVGKYAPDDDRLSFPLAVQVHHGLMDGLHIHRYFEAVAAAVDALIAELKS